MSAHVIGLEDRISGLGNVDLSFCSILIELRNAFEKYESNIHEAFHRDMRSRSNSFSQESIKAAIRNAVAYARASNVPHTVIAVERCDAYTNRAAKELLPKYPDLTFLPETMETLRQSIVFYNTHLVGGGVGGGNGGRCCGCCQMLSGVLVCIIFLSIAVAVLHRLNYLDRAKNVLA